MDKKKNIAFILPRLSNGGMERVAAALSKEIAKKYNLTIISLFQDNEKYDFAGEIIEINKIIGKNFLGKILNFLNRLRKINRIKKEKKIDLTLSFEQTCNFLNLLTGEDKKIISVHSEKSKENLSIGIYGKLYNWLMKIIYRRSEAIICVSKGIENDLRFNYKLDKQEQNVHVINNPYDIEFILKNIKNQKEEEEEPILINVGRLDVAKGHKNLFKILKLVKEEIPNIKLKILGKGDLEKELKELAKFLSIEANIDFLGYVNNPYREIEKADIFVMTSLYEGFPGVLVESLACKTPIISTDCTYGIREILFSEEELKEVRDKDIIEPYYAKYGIICPKFKIGNNLNEFSLEYREEEKIYAREIIKLLENKEMRKKYQKIGIEKAKKLDTTIISKKYIDLFEVVLNS